MTAKRPLAIALVIVTALQGVVPAPADANWFKKIGRTIERTTKSVFRPIETAANTIGKTAEAAGCVLVGNSSCAKRAVDQATSNARSTINNIGDAAVSVTLMPAKAAAQTVDTVFGTHGTLEGSVDGVENALQESNASVVDGATALANATGRSLEALGRGIVGDVDGAEEALDHMGRELDDAATHFGNVAGESLTATVRQTAMPFTAVAIAVDAALDSDLVGEVDQLSGGAERIARGIGGALGLAAKPENLARTALVYVAVATAGPAGAALVNVLYEKAVRGGDMTEEEMLKSFAVGLAAGYAAQGVQGVVEGANVVGTDVFQHASYASTAAANVTSNLTTDVGNVVFFGNNYTAEEFLESITTGLVAVELGDDLDAQALESALEAGLQAASIQAIENKFQIDLEEVEAALYEGMANGVVQAGVHGVVDIVMNSGLEGSGPADPDRPAAPSRAPSSEEQLHIAQSDLSSASADVLREIADIERNARNLAQGVLVFGTIWMLVEPTSKLATVPVALANLADVDRNVRGLSNIDRLAACGVKRRIAQRRYSAAVGKERWKNQAERRYFKALHDQSVRACSRR